MAFKYEATVQHGEDTTEYVNLGKDGVTVAEFEGKKILKVSKEALTKIAQAAFEEVEFCLRPAHTAKVAKILQDPEASDNDKFVALTMLKNACVAAKGILPFCQDTGTAICVAHKGQQVWTGFDDAEAISEGVYNAYTTKNLRYSQIAPLTMYEEKKGRWLCQQDLLLAHDQGAPQPEVLGKVPCRKGEDSRYSRLPPVPPGHRDWRYLCRNEHPHGEAR